MVFKNFKKVIISIALIFSSFSPIMGLSSEDYNKAVSDVAWCSIGDYATGYAINNGYYSNPTSSDPNISSANKQFIPDGCYSSFYEAKERVYELEASEEAIPVVLYQGAYMYDVVYATHAIIYMENASTSTTYVLYNEPSTTSMKKTYVNPTSQRDVAVIDIVNEDFAEVMISGVKGYLKLRDSSGTLIHQIIPISQLDMTSTTYDDATYAGYRVTRFGLDNVDTTSMFLEVLRGSNNSYMVKSGTADRISQMKPGVVYYSYDEHYFYDSLFDMITDYKDENYRNAINKTAYYNYYQYLPSRAKTLINEQEFNSYLLSVKPTAGDQVTYCYTSSGVTTSCSGNCAYKYTGPNSIIYNAGDAFLDGQNYYGINATLIYVKAILEGAYGMSTIARAKYNPFGVNAYDSSPFTSAKQYNSVYEGIESQFQTVMSLGYANPYDAKGRYNGSNVGNKASGANTLYASDPNWGWKLASLYRDIDAVSGFKDLNYYQLAVTTTPQCEIYESSDMNRVVEVMKNYNQYNDYVFDNVNLPVIIVDSATYGGKKVYKIVMDRPTDLSEGYYYAKDSDYGWVYASDVMLINTARDGYKDPADVGNITVNGNVTIDYFETPAVVYTTDSTKLYDSYRTDITSSYTTISKNTTFISQRAVTRDHVKYYEVIVDYTTTPYRTKYISASDLSVDKKAELVTTSASNVNVRKEPNTTSEIVGTIKNERSSLLYVSTETGEMVGEVDTWYEVVFDPLTKETAYISGAYSSTTAANDDIKEEESKPTLNYITSLGYDTTWYLSGLGVIDKVEAPNNEVMKYELVATSKLDGSVYTYPLETTCDVTVVSQEYNYDYAWYQGYVDFRKMTTSDGKTKALESGQYSLAIHAIGGEKEASFALYNLNAIPTQYDVVIKSGMTYSIKEDDNLNLYLEILNESRDLDLSAYSKMDMNVYQNSRVTKIVETKTGFKVEGYMFEAEVHWNDKNKIWREIVFVNTEDESTSLAYRKQATSIYNTWLNKNQTATCNGKYRLDYANYSVEVDPKNMNGYVGNVKGQVMTPGTYYVYMRISNGKESYLFPLVDRVLSDGSTMESDGTLPSAFTVSDPETRVLIYTVD